MRRHGTWVLLAVAGLLGAGCGGPAGDEQQPRPAARMTPTTWSVAGPGAAAPTTTAVTATAAPTADEAVPAAASGGADDDPVYAGHEARSGASAAAEAGDVAPTGQIEIPAIGLSHPTYEGIELSSIDRGPSHWPGSAQPGEAGNTVYPGHRTTHSRPFYDIDRLQPGDEVIFTVPSGRYVYEVRESFVVDDQDTWIVEPTADPTFTIFACHPKGSARQRFVVKGVLTSAPAPPPPPGPPPSTTTTEPSQQPLLPHLLP